MYQPLWRPEMGDLTHFFLQISQIIYLQMENFVFAILYLVYFALKYMYFEDLSRISENGGYLKQLKVTLIFGNSWISENGGYL